MKSSYVVAALLGLVAGSTVARSDTLYDAKNHAQRKGTGRSVGGNIEWRDCGSSVVLHFDSSYYFKPGNECNKRLVDTHSCKGKNDCLTQAEWQRRKDAEAKRQAKVKSRDKTSKDDKGNEESPSTPK